MPPGFKPGAFETNCHSHIRWIGEHGFPVYARYRKPVQSIGRWRVTDWQKPVYLRGATTATVIVHPGDFVLCDEDGGIADSRGSHPRRAGRIRAPHQTGNPHSR